MIERGHKLPLTRQCRFLKLKRGQASENGLTFIAGTDPIQRMVDILPINIIMGICRDPGRAYAHASSRQMQ